MPFKLYVDSRFRQDTGGNNSDSEFSIELPHPIQVKGTAFVDVCCLANSFYTIRAGENDRLHVSEDVGVSGTYRIVIIPEGQYNAITLKDTLVTALNTGRAITSQYFVNYDVPTNKLVIGNLDANDTFAIYPRGWLKANAATWNAIAGPTKQIDPLNLRDAGSVLGFARGTSSLTTTLPENTVSAAEVVNTQPYNQLFLRSSLGDGYSAIGPDGSGDIIRRITCTVPINDFILDLHGLPHDSVPVGDREISSLSFRLTDVFGNTVNTHGHPISFSICFLELE